MKPKNIQGTVVTVLENDPKRLNALDESTLSELQKAIFPQLADDVQEKIRAGYTVIVSDLESCESICEFNRETFRPSKHALKALAETLWPSIQEFYKDEAYRHEFEQWKAKLDKQPKKT